MSENPADRVWDVAVRKAVGEPGHRFELDVGFRSAAMRLVVFGPSGSGKSLTLKAIAGLLAPDGGHVRIGSQTLYDSATGVDVPAAGRRLGYVFQEYALFPHLTVRQNVGFSTRSGWRNPSRAAATRSGDDTERLLATFELAPLADRHPDQLSGGQRQRTALARAVAAKPRALLLDEPFAALDAPLRGRLRGELAELQARSGLPMLLITHDEADVAAFADEVVSLGDGRVA